MLLLVKTNWKTWLPCAGTVEVSPYLKPAPEKCVQASSAGPRPSEPVSRCDCISRDSCGLINGLKGLTWSHRFKRAGSGVGGGCGGGLGGGQRGDSLFGQQGSVSAAVVTLSERLRSTQHYSRLCADPWRSCVYICPNCPGLGSTPA